MHKAMLLVYLINAMSDMAGLLQAPLSTSVRIAINRTFQAVDRQTVIRWGKMNVCGLFRLNNGIDEDNAALLKYYLTEF